MANGGEDGSKGFSLSFGASKAAHRTKRIKISEDEEQPSQQLLTGFEAGGAVFQDGEGKTVVVDGATKRVIPTQGNDFRGLGPKKYNPKRFLPEKGDVQPVGQDEDHFQLAEAVESAPVQYGLTTMGRSKPEVGADGDTVPESRQANGGAGGTDAPVGQRVLGTGKDWEAEAFQKDVADLPDVSTLEEYTAMPVELFGEAMLRGMGWSEEKETAKDQAKEFVRRAPLLGLGATSAPPQAHKERRYIRPGESREAKKDLVVYDEEGHIKHTRTAKDKLVQRIVKGPAAGKHMRIIRGRHAGIRCRVTAINDQVEGRSQTAAVRLHPSEETVTVRVKELGELDDQLESNGHNREGTAHNSRSQDKGHAGAFARLSDGRAEPQQEERGQNGNEGSERSWLLPHIRVKIVDKRKGNGKLYLKKGEIIDVMSPTQCSVYIEGRGSVDAAQHELETVVPRREGSRILVVSGNLRGHRAKLLQRNVDSGQAAIQLTEDFSICKLSFDEIAEFVGDFGEEE